MKRLTVCVLAGLLLAPCGVFAQKVNVDWDRKYDFSKIETYSWLEGTPVPNPVSHQRITSAIEKLQAQ